MSHELLYTSAPSGLKRGSRGFATVLCTQGMPTNISSRLETLSGYRHLYSSGDPRSSLNPVAWSHLKVSIGGRLHSVLSRIADYGVDYSGRTNKLAHHVVLEQNEFPDAGPVWLLATTGIMRTEWDGQTVALPAGPSIPIGDQAPAVCEHWSRITGDAGWGGRVAEWLADESSQPAWIIFAPEQSQELLSLLSESMALLPVPQRWRATFTTYFTSLPPEVNCKVRCVLAGTDEARSAASRARSIDLSEKLPTLPETIWVTRARQGRGGLPSRAEVQPETPDDTFWVDPAMSDSEVETRSVPHSPPVPPPKVSELTGRPVGVSPAFPPGGGPPRLPTAAIRKKTSRVKSPLRAKPVLIVAAILLLTVGMGLTMGFVALQGRSLWQRSNEIVAIADADNTVDGQRRELPSALPHDVKPAQESKAEPSDVSENDKQRQDGSAPSELENDNQPTSDLREGEPVDEAKVEEVLETDVAGADPMEPDEEHDQSNANSGRAGEEEAGSLLDEEASEDAVKSSVPEPPPADTTATEFIVAHVELTMADDKNEPQQGKHTVAHFEFERDRSWSPTQSRWAAGKSLAHLVDPNNGSSRNVKATSDEWTWNVMYHRQVAIDLSGPVGKDGVSGKVRVLDWNAFDDQDITEKGRLLEDVAARVYSLSKETKTFSTLSSATFRLNVSGNHDLGYKVNASKLLSQAETLRKAFKKTEELPFNQKEELRDLEAYVGELKKVKNWIRRLNEKGDIELDCGRLTLEFHPASDPMEAEELLLKFRLQLNIEDEE